MLVDSHCHLDFPAFAGRVPEVLADARAAGVGRVVTISTHVGRADTYRALAEAHEEVFFSVGTHPHHAAEETDVPTEEIVALSEHPRCVAVGEAGLDYHYDRSPRDLQQRVFRTHIAAARAARLPLVIHARDADDDMIAILSEEMRRGAFDAVLHCFSSGARLAEIGVEPPHIRVEELLAQVRRGVNQHGRLAAVRDALDQDGAAPPAIPRVGGIAGAPAGADAGHAARRAAAEDGDGQRHAGAVSSGTRSADAAFANSR